MSESNEAAVIRRSVLQDAEDMSIEDLAFEVAFLERKIEREREETSRRLYIDQAFRDVSLHGEQNHPTLLSVCPNEICRQQYKVYQEMVATLGG